MINTQRYDSVIITALKNYQHAAQLSRHHQRLVPMLMPSCPIADKGTTATIDSMVTEHGRTTEGKE